ncbi:MAG: phosphoglycerate dehydrogenase [Lachnospiraceae bacterium]|jgi:D-3-phosphoglycerate dehydrogenase|nr:phosphoglycerate dehydrogenase [Lachnospiraceae bacterium]
MPDKILATPRSFGKTDTTPIKLLEDAGYEVVLNPVGRILTEEEMIEYIADVSGIIVGVDPLSSSVMASANKLKAISKYGVGTDNIDLDEAKRLGIPVSITKGANANAVADFAFTLMCACARKVTEIDAKCHNKDWGKVTTADIYGKKLGILGLGAVGKGLAKRAGGFEMEILAYDVYWDDDFAKERGIKYAEPEKIYKECDFISVHMPLTKETQNWIGDKEFQLMKPTAILINTARGGIIDEDSLAKALHEKTIYAAGIDTFSNEPPANEQLYKLPNLIMGSHCAASTQGAVSAMGMMAAENLLQSLRKE